MSQGRSRRVTLAQSYRDLAEKQIRARLEGPLSDVERVIAQAELIRRGVESDHVDTAPATGFAPTSALDLFEAEASGARPIDDTLDGPRGAPKSVLAFIALLAVCVVGYVVMRELRGH